MSVDSSAVVRLAQRYALRKRIAVGGMGEVHLATDERLGRPVAVKVLAPEFADSPDFVERFRREALTAAALSHPNIAQVYDYDVDGSSHFIVMEHVDGTDLARLLRERGRITPGDAVRIAEQVCSALTVAHRSGVVHRDIKPGNVIVRPDGTVKVTDFGIAQALGQASLTDTGTVMGTAAYISPEQARGQATSPASDIYSLGILLFQMLTGAVPFEGDAPVAIAMRHLDEAVPLPSSRVADLPASLDEVVARATAKAPGERYADAAEMAQALRNREPGADAATRALPLGAATSVLSTSTSTAAMPALDASDARRAVPTRASGDTNAGRSRRGANEQRQRGSRPGPIVWVLVAVVLALVVATAFVLRSGLGTSNATGPSGSASSPASTPSTPATSTARSDGPTVPDGVVGQAREAAVKDLIRSGVNVRWVLVRSTSPEDQVLGTFPAEGEPMTPGQTVALVVSRGHAPDEANTTFVVPDGLVGTDAKQASARLDGEDGLRVTRVTIPSDAAKGEVIGTWPAVGAQTSDGVVALVVSGGSASNDEGDKDDKNG
jgi:serine/threonine-protein kinase